MRVIKHHRLKAEYYPMKLCEAEIIIYIDSGDPKDDRLWSMTQKVGLTPLEIEAHGFLVPGQNITVDIGKMDIDWKDLKKIRRRKP